MNIKNVASQGGIGLIILNLSACSWFSSAPEPIAEPVSQQKQEPEPPPAPVIKTVSINFIPSADLNTMHGQSYPLKVRVYQLKSIYNFEGYDFRAITDNEQQSLQDDVIKKQDLHFKPAESPRVYTIDKLDPETQYIGFVAYYMDIKNAKWQAIYLLSEQNQHKMSVLLTDKKIIIQ